MLSPHSRCTSRSLFMRRSWAPSGTAALHRMCSSNYSPDGREKPISGVASGSSLPPPGRILRAPNDLLAPQLRPHLSTASAVLFEKCAPLARRALAKAAVVAMLLSAAEHRLPSTTKGRRSSLRGIGAVAPPPPLLRRRSVGRPLDGAASPQRRFVGDAATGTPPRQPPNPWGDDHHVGAEEDHHADDGAAPLVAPPSNLAVRWQEVESPEAERPRPAIDRVLQVVRRRHSKSPKKATDIKTPTTLEEAPAQAAAAAVAPEAVVPSPPLPVASIVAETAHERHRRHQLEHVNDGFAQQALKIHTFVTQDGVEWIDVHLASNAAELLRRNMNRLPTEDELADVYHAGIAGLLQQHNVHDTMIEDAMERVLMPQTVTLPECTCLILRCVQPEAEPDADSLQTLTHRLTIFLFKKKIITLHRTELPPVRSIRRRWDQRFATSTQAHLLNALVYGCLQTFRKELARATVEFDALEARLFEPQKTRSILAREMYVIKRRAAVCARVVNMSAEAYSHAAPFLKVSTMDGYFQDVIHEFQQVKTACEELNDNAHNVLQLLFQLSSYQLNELMRVLTMFSAFFIPLTFIAGVYGMNFENMPLVKDENGAYYCGGVMTIVGVSLLLWFRSRGF